MRSNLHRDTPVYLCSAILLLVSLVVVAAGDCNTQDADQCDSEEVGLLQTRAALQEVGLGSAVSSETDSKEVSVGTVVSPFPEVAASDPGKTPSFPVGIPFVPGSNIPHPVQSPGASPYPEATSSTLGIAGSTPPILGAVSSLGPNHSVSAGSPSPEATVSVSEVVPLVPVASAIDMGVTAGLFALLLLAIRFSLPSLRELQVESIQSPSLEIPPEGDHWAKLRLRLGSAKLEISYSTYVAEFFGTFVLVFTVGCCTLGGSASWNAFAIGCVLMFMIYSTKSASGANLNPAVSLAIWMSGDRGMTTKNMLGYWCAQVAAGVAAGICFGCLFLTSSPVAPGPGFDLWHGGVVEAIYTSILCFVVLSVDRYSYSGLAIGSVVIAGGYAVGGISGALFNPAVAIGLDLSAGRIGNGLVWTLFELFGALTAAVLSRSINKVREEGRVVPLDVRCLSEFLGTFVLVLTVELNVLMSSPATALSAGMALVGMIYALADVSGAHFNPAVTLAVSLRDTSFPRFDAAVYVVTQIIAGVAAGASCAVFHMMAPQQDRTIGLPLGATSGVIDAGMVELVATTVLAYVVLSVTTSSSKENDYFGLAIGSCVIAGGFAIGGISGGELNPAVSIGLATEHMVRSGMEAAPSGRNCILFSMFECMGGMAAATLFQFTHAKEA